MKAYSRTVPGSAFYFAAKPDPVFKENKKMTASETYAAVILFITETGARART